MKKNVMPLVALGLALATLNIFGAEFYKSRKQTEYLMDLYQFPLQFMVKTSEADSIMNAAEGFLAKNMAHFFHVSGYAISTQVNHGFINVSRVDLGDGWSEIEVVVSRHKTTRRNQAGVMGHQTAVREITSELRGPVKLGSLANQFLIDSKENQVLVREFRYELMLGRFLVKFLVTGKPYPSATMEEIILSNIPQEPITHEDLDTDKYKLDETFSLKGSGIDLLEIFTKVNARNLKGAKFILTEKTNGDLTGFSLYKEK